MTDKLDPPKPRPRPLIYKTGERPPNDTSLIPHSTGESVRISFRADAITVADIEQHLRRLEEMAPVMAVTVTDALRSLVQEGARSFRKRLPEDASTDDEDGDE